MQWNQISDEEQLLFDYIYDLIYNILFTHRK